MANIRANSLFLAVFFILRACGFIHESEGYSAILFDQTGIGGTPQSDTYANFVADMVTKVNKTSVTVVSYGRSPHVLLKCQENSTKLIVHHGRFPTEKVFLAPALKTLRQIFRECATRSDVRKLVYLIARKKVDDNRFQEVIEEAESLNKSGVHIVTVFFNNSKTCLSEIYKLSDEKTFQEGCCCDKTVPPEEIVDLDCPPESTTMEAQLTSTTDREAFTTVTSTEQMVSAAFTPVLVQNLLNETEEKSAALQENQELARVTEPACQTLPPENIIDTGCQTHETEFHQEKPEVARLQGPKGDKGDAGERGTSGPKGESGLKGERGDAGVAGPPGDQGLKGEMGITGPKGLKGEEGIAGKPGPAGPLGPMGPKGDKGDRGFPGINGLSGVAGEMGPQGSRGEAGVPGPCGPPGPRGKEGERGQKGSPGSTGPVGIQGPPGLPGPPGPGFFLEMTNDCGNASLCLSANGLKYCLPPSTGCSQTNHGCQHICTDGREDARCLCTDDCVLGADGKASQDDVIDLPENFSKSILNLTKKFDWSFFLLASNIVNYLVIAIVVVWLIVASRSSKVRHQKLIRTLRDQRGELGGSPNVSKV